MLKESASSRPAAPIRSGTSRKMKYPKSIACLSVFALLSFSPAQGRLKCEWNPAWEEFGLISKEVNTAFGQFESQIDGKLQERGYSFKSHPWVFTEQKEPLLRNARLVRMRWYGVTDETSVLYLLLQPESGAAAVFPVQEGMINDLIPATDGRQIEQFNSVLKASKTELSGEAAALLYVRLSQPLDQASKTCVEGTKGNGSSKERVRLRTDLPSGSWLQWTVVVNTVGGIQKVSVRRHR